ncbi:MAG: long-chain fatty acid--CoA ligase, partial [Nitrospirae bacterium]
MLFESEDEIDSILKSHNKEHIRDKFINLSSIYKRAGEIKEKSHISLRELVEKIEDEDLSAIIYTSGTTGTPKGVMLTNKNLITNAEDWIEVLGPLIPVERVDLLWLPTSHIFGWGELGLGNTLDFLTYFSDPKHVLDVMPYVKPTIFMSVPAYWEKLYRRALSSSNNKREQLKKLIELTGGKLKFCLSGGAGLKREVKEFFYEAGLLIIEGYGLTECSPTLTMNRGDDFDFDTVGKPFPRVKIKIAPDGEILAKGPNVFIGYYKDPGATKEAFDEDGWFKTGDLGEWTERGFLKIKGRKKDIIVTSGGKNIAPQPIESMFDDDPYIEHIVLYGNERKYLTALITLKEEAILRYAKEHNIPHSDFKTLVRDPRIYELIKERIEKVNKKLASF